MPRYSCVFIFTAFASIFRNSPDILVRISCWILIFHKVCALFFLSFFFLSFFLLFIPTFVLSFFFSQVISLFLFFFLSFFPSSYYFLVIMVFICVTILPFVFSICLAPLNLIHTFFFSKGCSTIKCPGGGVEIFLGNPPYTF